MKKKINMYIAGALLALAVAPLTGMAATAQANLQVNASLVAATGSISVSGPMNFGTLNIPGTGQTPYDAQTTITCNVTNGVPYTLKWNGGSHITGNMGNGPRMRSGSLLNYKYVNYKLYHNSARTIKWNGGISTSANRFINKTGTGANQAITIYGQAIVNSTDIAGAYSDTAIITLTY